MLLIWCDLECTNCMVCISKKMFEMVEKIIYPNQNLKKSIKMLATSFFAHLQNEVKHKNKQNK